MSIVRYITPLALAVLVAELPAQVRTLVSTRDADRPRLGISTGPGGHRDTLGLLVTDVLQGGPAQKAGIEEGDRLVSINGTSLKLSRDDLDDLEMTGLGTRRLLRELEKARPGDQVTLRVHREGQTRDVTVTTVSADALQPERATISAARRASDERASLGIGLGTPGSRRDTLGVLIVSVVDDGPAERARIEEGDRIAAINGVDLRVASVDAGDATVAGSRMRRLTREMEKVKAGDEVELRLVRAGQMRTVRVKTVAARDLPRRAGFAVAGDGMTFFGDGMNGFTFSVPRSGQAIAPGEARIFRFDGDGPGGSVRIDKEQIEGRVREMMERIAPGRAPLRLRGWISNEGQPASGRLRIVTPM